jgi:hypothetical protein
MCVARLGSAEQGAHPSGGAAIAHKSQTGFLGRKTDAASPSSLDEHRSTASDQVGAGRSGGSADAERFIPIRPQR